MSEINPKVEGEQINPKGDGDPMDEFELALQHAMQRVEVRAETTRKFLAIAAEAERTRRSSGRRWLWHRPAGGGLLLVLPRSWAMPVWGTAVAAVLVLGAVVGEQVHRQHERTRATQEFETATRITDRALEQTREQLVRSGVPLE
jgi:hypothetical protein